jgi:MFS family permease
MSPSFLLGLSRPPRSHRVFHFAHTFARPNAGLSIGPILGGVLSEKLGWRWTFGFLSILSGVVWIIFLVGFPETCRNIVGNGSKPPRGINASLLALLSRSTSPKSIKAPRCRLRHIPNPFPCLLIIFHKDTALILAVNAIFYVNYICLQASLSPLLTQIYSLSGTNVGLCYLSYGIACAFATYGTGLYNTPSNPQLPPHQNSRLIQGNRQSG